jgi:hypothetical protein
MELAEGDQQLFLDQVRVLKEGRLVQEIPVNEKWMFTRVRSE